MEKVWDQSATFVPSGFKDVFQSPEFQHAFDPPCRLGSLFPDLRQDRSGLCFHKSQLFDLQSHHAKHAKYHFEFLGNSCTKMIV